MLEYLMMHVMRLNPLLAQAGDALDRVSVDAEGSPSLMSVLFIGVPAGVGLAAASGFRVFLPMFVTSLAINMNMTDSIPVINELPIGDGFDWLGSDIATVILGIATAVEVGGYYVPWVDNLLDTIATPAAAIAGTTAMAALMGDMDPSVKWVMAIVAGGGVAGSVQFLTVGTRAASTATTGGVGNPVVSTAEAGGSLLITVLVIVVPIVAGVVALCVLWWVFKKLFRRKKKAAEAAAAG